MKPVIKYKSTLNPWYLKGEVRFPGTMDLHGRDLRAFFPDAVSAASIREMDTIKTTEDTLIMESKWPGVLKVELKNTKDHVLMSIKADFVYTFSQGVITFFFVFFYSLFFIPFQASKNVLSGVIDFLLSSTGLSGVMCVNIIIFAALYYGTAALYRRPKIDRYKRVFTKIAAAFADFKQAYDQMPPEKKDVADYQPEYAALLPQEDEGINLGQLCRQEKTSWTFDIRRPNIDMQLSRAMEDAGMLNSILGDSFALHHEITKPGLMDIRANRSFRHYSLGTCRLNLFIENINTMITPYGDHTQIDTWSYIPVGAPMKASFCMLGLLAVFMIAFAYLHVMYFGYANPVVLGSFAVISFIGSFLFWSVVNRKKLRKNRRTLETALPELLAILSNENAARFQNIVLPFLNQLKTAYPAAIKDARVEGFSLIIDFKDQNTAARVNKKCQTQFSLMTNTRLQGSRLSLFPPVGITKKKKLEASLAAVENAVTAAVAGE
jgi:hypothetical protein